MIEVISHIAAFVVMDGSIKLAEVVPNARSPAVHGGSALYLVSSSCHTPGKVLGHIHEAAGSVVLREDIEFASLRKSGLFILVLILGKVPQLGLDQESLEAFSLSQLAGNEVRESSEH